MLSLLSIGFEKFRRAGEDRAGDKESGESDDGCQYERTFREGPQIDCDNEIVSEEHHPLYDSGADEGENYPGKAVLPAENRARDILIDSPRHSENYRGDEEPHREDIDDRMRY